MRRVDATGWLETLSPEQALEALVQLDLATRAERPEGVSHLRAELIAAGVARETERRASAPQPCAA